MSHPIEAVQCANLTHTGRNPRPRWNQRDAVEAAQGLVDTNAFFPTMEHDEPYMAHVGPVKTGEIAWTFSRAGDVDFDCLIAGHHQAGKAGKVKVVALAAGNSTQR
jgi:hypothetical protein